MNYNFEGALPQAQSPRSPTSSPGGQTMNVKEWQARCEKKTVWMTFATFGGALGLWYRLKPTPVPFLMNMPAISLASVAATVVNPTAEAADEIAV